jgi:hypothetical protein
VSGTWKRQSRFAWDGEVEMAFMKEVTKGYLLIEV